EEHVRRPTTRRLHMLDRALAVSDGAGEGRAGVAPGRGLLPRFCKRPEFIYRVAPAKQKNAATIAPVQVVLRLDPACVHVDCPGPIREDVPSHSLLGEGLAGKNNRLKRGLQRRAPTIPLLGLGSGWGGVLGVSVAVRI